MKAGDEVVIGSGPTVIWTVSVDQSRSPGFHSFTRLERIHKGRIETRLIANPSIHPVGWMPPVIVKSGEDWTGDEPEWNLPVDGG